MNQAAVYVMPGHRRSGMVCGAMARGIVAAGDQVRQISYLDYTTPDHDACVFYGYVPQLQKIMAEYRALDKPAVYVDLGYWRREGLTGYHKVVVNGRHPTAYFQNRRHKGDRFKTLGVTISPWRIGGHNILLAGMGHKASVIAEGMAFERFERDAAETLLQHTKRPVFYRPKPNDIHGKPIAGTTFARDLDLERIMSDCHAVVTHHSNVAVDALMAGVPAFCWHGVAAPMALQDMTQIERPWFPGDRERWANDVAFTQFSVPEIAAGVAWRHLKDEGLIG